jgi:hypothetical protein
MPKKRKLNSTNPKYKKEENKTKYRKVLMQTVKNCKIYFCYEIKEKDENI